MTAPTDSAAQPAAFVRRADWSDENNYPPDDMADASAWAWKFLRRNRKYQDDHQKWGNAFADVPARSFDDMTLIDDALALLEAPQGKRPSRLSTKSSRKGT
ncbi:transcriptional regulator domain-containing protein [Burkholderia lata]|uniref:transcriptional regulator domain-containing protein n=1 Tax=Burkholderia lata (strain ATCC 17760 / DSM 23089 / LMG 22485 / NCIMB 9086 / R18194 / 383) TaxID=482957 RepID=UPI00145480F6|nr:DUF6499 domain-containing protein [Burkholderia lata]VWB65059.1 hypothetical protein BLA15816_03072 [Burkholderia lata]